MSVSRKMLADASFCEEVERLYRSQVITMEEVAAKLGTTLHNVGAVLKARLSPAEYKRLKSAAYSRSRVGAKNPNYGIQSAVKRVLHSGRMATWNGDGYTFEHRSAMATALGLKELPEGWHVHHIDGDKTNDTLDNLALVTPKGHQALHKQKLGRLHLWEKEEFGISLLKEMQAMSPKD